MGAAVFEAVPLPYRPAYFDKLEPYPAEDGQSLFVVYGRKKDAAYYVLRWACKVARLVRKVERAVGRDVPEDDVTNPNGVERFGTWDSEEKAQAECLHLHKQSGGRLAVGYDEVKVNRTYGLERRPMRGLTDPTKWLFRGGPPTAEQARFTLVGVDDVSRLNAHAARVIEKCESV